MMASKVLRNASEGENPPAASMIDGNFERVNGSLPRGC